MPVKVRARGAAENDQTQIIYINPEVLEGAAVRRDKLQATINQIEAEGLASGKASQQLIDKLTQQNAQAIEALDYYYMENRLVRFKVSAEYHSTQSGAWNGIATSGKITVDVVNKGSGLDPLKAP